MSVRRPEWVLAGATVISLPMLSSMLHGSIDTTDVLIRFLGALLVCWVLMSILTSVFDRYAEQAARREFEVRMTRMKTARNSEATQNDADSESSASNGG